MQLLLPRDVGVADLGAVAVFSVSYGFARSAPVPAAGEGPPPTPPLSRRLGRRQDFRGGR